jgi:signal transduction histidine kinase
LIDHLLATMDCDEKSILLQRILDESDNLFILLDNERRLTFASRGFLDLLNLKKEEALLRKFPDDFSEMTVDEKKQIITDLNTADVKGKSSSYQLFQRKQGEIILQYSIKRTPLENGLEHYIIEAQDKSWSFLRNQLLMKKTIALEEDKKHLQEFTHIVSHNSRNPVNNLKSLVDLYSNQHLSTDEFLSLSGSVINSLELTLNNLSDILRHQAGAQIKRSEVSLQNVCEHVIKQFSFDVVRLGAKVSYDCKNLKVNFPLVYIESIFSNMISNAIKYKKPNTPLELQIQAEKKGDTIHLRFTDNGIGIDMDAYGSELFKPYTTESASNNRGGLGLSILAQHLEKHGDEVLVESKLGVGTSFCFVFKNDSVVG